MLRRLWQSAMIALARSGSLKQWIQANRAASALKSRFISGTDPEDAIAIGRALKLRGLGTSFFYLGEYVDDRQGVADAVAGKLAIADALDGANSGIDVHISVDPTQIGLLLGPDQLHANGRKIAAAVARVARERAGQHRLMLDMEDPATIAPTLALHDTLFANDIPVALTLQAYLRRTEDDLAARIQPGGCVRLVKGAFAGGSDIAFTGNAAIKANYRRLIDLMFSADARASGFYPVVATHDDALQDYAIAAADRQGWGRDAFEFEMLYGVRPALADDLAARGFCIRLYTPFGRDWWPYAIRRIGENPGSLPLLLRALIQR